MRTFLRHAHELRDRVARGVFAPAFVESAMQLADILTKALRVGSHLDMVGRLLYIPNSMTVKEGEWITVERKHRCTRAACVRTRPPRDSPCSDSDIALRNQMKIVALQRVMKAVGDGHGENDCEFRAPTCDLCRLLGVNKPKTTTFRAIYRVLDPFARKRDHKPVSNSCYFSWKRRLDPLVSAAGLTELYASK